MNKYRKQRGKDINPPRYFYMIQKGGITLTGLLKKEGYLVKHILLM
ncbi:hypothetical protein MUA19_07115 [Staphylococcus chromogenes]|nr:hypothetical protein [Staphylococcus chromogenes]UXS67051.1 hypothetical protein MUA19_07115 [Staphylococcus chromogenes]